MFPSPLGDSILITILSHNVILYQSFRPLSGIQFSLLFDLPASDFRYRFRPLSGIQFSLQTIRKQRSEAIVSVPSRGFNSHYSQSVLR